MRRRLSTFAVGDPDGQQGLLPLLCLVLALGVLALGRGI